MATQANAIALKKVLTGTSRSPLLCAIANGIKLFCNSNGMIVVAHLLLPFPGNQVLLSRGAGPEILHGAFGSEKGGPG